MVPPTGHTILPVPTFTLLFDDLAAELCELALG
jgi:hypothetical protein